MKKINKIKLLIKEANIDEVFRLLSNICLNNTEFTLLNSRYSKLTTDTQLGIISDEYRNIEYNKIVSSILSELDNLEDYGGTSIEKKKNKTLIEEAKSINETKMSNQGGYELIKIPSGCCKMGSEAQGASYDREAIPIHEVEISEYYLGLYPVTNAQYSKFLKSNRNAKEPEYWHHARYNQPNQPVVGVSYLEAQQYCEWAGLVLPTEAQWEYACKANTNTLYWIGDKESELKQIAWIKTNSGGLLHPVCQKCANPFGLFDMHGNIWEWCRDSLRIYSDEKVINPLGNTLIEGNNSFAIKGGSFDCDARKTLSSIRRKRNFNYVSYNLGFRAVWDSNNNLPPLKKHQTSNIKN